MNKKGAALLLIDKGKPPVVQSGLPSPSKYFFKAFSVLKMYTSISTTCKLMITTKAMVICLSVKLIGRVSKNPVHKQVSARQVKL